MSVLKAEQDALDLLDKSWWTSDRSEPLPVEPMDLARGLGIKVREVFLPSDESGNIVMNAFGEAIISLNRSDHPNRQRFTCAHEIGHYSMRRRYQGSSSQTFTDYRTVLAGLGTDGDEIYANQFAAALLMPAHLVKRGVRQGASAEKLARRFGTSVQAMEVRLRNLKLG